MHVPPAWIRRAGRLIHSLFLSWGIQEMNRKHMEFEEFSLNLQGACVMASYVLWRVLVELGEPAEFVYSDWECHAWVEWRGWVLDPTYTQFNDHSRKLRWVKIRSKTWGRSKYTEGIAGAEALRLTRDMSEHSVERHRKRLATMIKEVVREVQRGQDYDRTAQEGLDLVARQPCRRETSVHPVAVRQHPEPGNRDRGQARRRARVQRQVHQPHLAGVSA